MSRVRTARVEGFPPLADARARVLVLGTMPGRESLLRREYYGNPRNQFWSFAGALFGFDPTEPYARRVRALIAAGVAVWDVARCCDRRASSDSSIAAVEPNDLAGFFAVHPLLAGVFFNGRKAHELFERRVVPDLPAAALAVPRTTLPSTSPAHAGMERSEKLLRWRAVARAASSGSERSSR
jgi:hypoxanthine-DNA glycosylase